MEHYEMIIKSIVQAQMAIIGPMAIDEANKTNRLEVSKDLNTIKIKTTPTEAIDMLIKQYADLFGKISIDVSKEAAHKYIANINESVELPASIK